MSVLSPEKLRADRLPPVSIRGKKDTGGSLKKCPVNRGTDKMRGTIKDDEEPGAVTLDLKEPSESRRQKEEPTASS